MINNGKSSSPVILPNGDIFTFFNDTIELNGLAIHSENDVELYTFTKEDDEDYRFLQYNHFFSNMSNNNKIKFVPCRLDTTSKAVVPLYECINPIVQYNAAISAATIVFWTNVPFETELERIGTAPAEGEDDNRPYMYDATQIYKVKQSELENLSFSKGAYKRLLCSSNINFNVVKHNDELITLPVLDKPQILQVIENEDYPIFDFSSGGNSGGRGGGRHDHASNSSQSQGFAYAVYAPSTGIVQQPWT